jgi:hypothetical protein
MIPLPPWPARSKADNLAMLFWLNARLDQMQDAWEHDAFFGRLPEQQGTILDIAIDSAEHGNIEDLRRELVKLADDPRIAKFVNLPKKPKGERWRQDKGSVFDGAVRDVARIKFLWKKFYGKQRRHDRDGWSAVRFAAMRWEMSELLEIPLSKRLKKHPADQSMR